MRCVSVYQAPLEIFSPQEEGRQPGCHLSDIYSAVAADMFPRWFRKYENNQERVRREVNHFTKGLVLEEAWGLAMSQMLRLGFERPEQRQEEGIWCSPDGYLPPLMEPVLDVPEALKGVGAVAPSIWECKVTLKSCAKTSTFTNDYANGNQEVREKFLTWLWQVMGYCYVWRCHTAYICVLHLLGDYGEQRPWTPQAAVHRLDFEAKELALHWAWMVKEGKRRGLLPEQQEVTP